MVPGPLPQHETAWANETWGVFTWPALRPVRVMGMHGTAAVIGGRHRWPPLALARWGTIKGGFATRLPESEEEAWRVCLRKGGPLVVPVVARGSASGYGLELLFPSRPRGVRRGNTTPEVLTRAAERKARWQRGQEKTSRAQKEIGDTNTGEQMPCDRWWRPLRPPQSEQQVFLVKARGNKGMRYLLTKEPV